MKKIVVGITGASGAIYAMRLLEVLIAAGCQVHLTISPAATQVFRTELGLTVELDHFDASQLTRSDEEIAADSKLSQLYSSKANHAMSSVFSDSDISAAQLVYHRHDDFSAGIASGSFLTDGMVICPCSMGTLASIATGMSRNLIQRAADVHLKERRPLIVVPRETPLGAIQLDNMKRLAEAGGIILAAMPGFYHHPVTIHDLVDFVVGRICDQLGIEHKLHERWG